MREKRNFAERAKALKGAEAKKKYFIICEGEETEQAYFEAVNEYRNAIGINPLIELVPIIKGYSERGWSNPKKILDRMMQILDEVGSSEISYETLLNGIMEYLHEIGILTTSKVMERRIWDILEMACGNNLQVQLSDKVKNLNEDASKLFRILEENSVLTKVVDEASDIIGKYAITYAEGYDKICFIIDRDRESFVSHPDNDQYGYVLKKCRDNGFGFYLSNPNFEFWLLLHFDEVFSLDEQQILNNPKVNASRRYTEQQLRNFLPGYTKSKYHVNELMSHIQKAIENEKRFCEDEEKLEHSVGSRVGLLIEELQK